MANQEQNPPQQEQPFVAAKHVSFNLEDIILNTNNEVALLYPEHTNKDFFKCVSDIISKSKALENSKVSFLIPTGGIYGEVGVNTFRNTIGAHYLPYSSEYVSPPSIVVVRHWFPTIRYGEEVFSKGTLRKILLPPRWRLLMAQIIQCLGGKTRGFDQIMNKDAIILYSLANGINIDYANIFWEDIINMLKKKQREKVVPYTRFLSLLIMHKMKDKYEDGDVTLYPTQVFSVNNWALKPNQHEEPPFTDHMLAICFEAKPVHSTSLKQPSVSSKEATKGGSSKAPTSSKTSHFKKRKESSSAMDSNPSQPPVSTPVDTGMHKEDQQATGGLTSLGVTSEERAYPQLSSGMPTFNLNKIMFSASFIIHSKSASGCDALADSTAEADPGLSAPNDSIPQQQGMDEGTKKTSFNHISVGKEASSIARQVKEEESSRTIKLEDLAKLVSNVQTSFKDLDSPEDDHVIVVDDIDEDEEDEVHTTTNAETKDTSAPKSSSPRSSQIQELTNQVIILQFQKHKPKLEKNKAEAALLKTQPTFPNDLSSKFNELTKEVKGLKKQVYEFEIELPRDLKEIPTKLEDFTKTVTSLTSQVAELKTLQWEFPVEFLSLLVQVASVQAKLKTLDALPSLFLPKSSSQPEGEHIKKDKGKKAMYSEEVEKESTNSGSNDDETHVTGSMKKLEEDAKAEAAKQEGEDPLDKLNDLSNKKIKHADDIHDYFKANKRLKSSVQYGDHLAGTVLNKPVLGMIMFNSYHRQDFVTIEDMKDFSNTMIYTVQEIFFRRHQDPGLDDHARTFSSILLAEIDKRNLNPLKQIRVIEQLRQ
ncbi:hypothetical protein Tco_0246444 [Tanacetum coccineum]